MKYITEEQYKIAESNNISKRIVFKRVNDYGWTIEDAITKKVMTRAECRMKYPKYVYEELKKNKISLTTFHGRIASGWSLQDAITKKVMTKTECRLKYPQYVYDNLKKNNISRNTFHARIFRGWDIHDACTTPCSTVTKYNKKKK